MPAFGFRPLPARVVAAAVVPTPGDLSRRAISQAERISFLQKTAPVLMASRPFEAR
jgi:hypothetical protein